MDNLSQTEAGKPSGADDDSQSETGTVFESNPVGLAQEILAFGESETRHRRGRLPTRGQSPGLLNRLSMKVSRLPSSWPLLTENFLVLCLLA